MSATILPFAPRAVPRPPQARARAVASIAERFGIEWSSRHHPLVAAALDLLAAGDDDFDQRCRLIASEPGALVRLVDQLSKLAGAMSDVAEALALTVTRIRAVPAFRAQPTVRA